MDNRPIGIFDSGVGGLSVLREVQKLLPNESIIYLADQANIPYGNKTESQLRKIISKDIEFLEGKDVKIVIIACNTATVYALDFLRSKFNIPIMGVVPVVKTLANKTKSGRVAVFSTPATAKSQYLINLINKFAPNTQVYTVGSSGLEHLVEQGKTNGEEINKAVKKALLPLLTKNVDSIALGCTHYPFLNAQMKKVLGSKVRIYDSGSAIARRTRQVLENENSLSNRHGKDYFFTTADPDKFKKVAEKLLGYGVDRVYKARL